MPMLLHKQTETALTVAIVSGKPIDSIAKSSDAWCAERNRADEGGNFERNENYRGI